MRLRVFAAVACVAAALILASCVPHVVRPPELDRDSRAARYREALAAREGRGVAVEAQVSLWAETERADLPGAQARLALAAPDAFRLRVQSLFGTALDLGGRGDSLTAYLPPKRVGLALDASADSLGVSAPGALVFRALSAAWRPPAPAWAESRWEDSLLAVRWVELGDSLEMSVGAQGLPVSLTVHRADGFVGRARYRAWDRTSGVAWPSWMELEDGRASLRLTCKVRSLQFPAHPDRDRLAVRLPAEASRLTLAQLRRAIERWGSF
jgi:hypothetical protein